MRRFFSSESRDRINSKWISICGNMLSVPLDRGTSAFRGDQNYTVSRNCKKRVDLLRFKSGKQTKVPFINSMIWRFKIRHVRHFLSFGLLFSVIGWFWAEITFIWHLLTIDKMPLAWHFLCPSSEINKKEIVRNSRNSRRYGNKLVGQKDGSISRR